MQNSTDNAATGGLPDCTEEDALRADMYEFLAALLRAEPDDALIDHVSRLNGDTSPIGAASGVLATLASSFRMTKSATSTCGSS